MNGRWKISSVATICVAAVATLLAAGPAVAQDGAGAWRVECSGDGKVLDCRAVQQLVTREDRQLVVQLVARLVPEAKPVVAAATPAAMMPVLTLQLPLGINVGEPLVLKVDDGKEEKIPLQTCTATGCFASVPLKDPLLAALRGGKQLKLALQDSNKRVINIDVPLLGFGLAFDKATK